MYSEFLFCWVFFKGNVNFYNNPGDIYLYNWFQEDLQYFISEQIFIDFGISILEIPNIL